MQLLRLQALEVRAGSVFAAAAVVASVAAFVGPEPLLVPAAAPVVVPAGAGLSTAPDIAERSFHVSRHRRRAAAVSSEFAVV